MLKELDQVEGLLGVRETTVIAELWSASVLTLLFCS
jgi:hypothetical protein